MRTWLLGVLAALVLAVPGAGAADPAPNGRIVFASDRNGADELFSVAPDGTGLRQLTRSFPAAWGLDWSPRGGRIAFSSADDWDEMMGIWTVRPDGTGLRRLTRPPRERCDSRPAWSPDARRIAFARDRCDDDAELWVMNADGSSPRRLRALGRQRATGISWSPDGRLLAVELLDGCSVLLVRADGSRPRRLFCRLRVEGVTFSPDGRQLAFARNVGGGNDRFLSIARLDGSGLRRIGPRLRGADELTWSRTGLIAFTTRTDGRLGIHTIRSDGTGFRRLTRTPASASDVSPTWAPNGRTLAYVRDGRGIDRQLRMVRSDGAGDRVIARYVPAISPSWTVDGRHIVFAQGTSPAHAHIIGEQGGSGRILLERPGEIAHPRLAPGGKSLAYVYYGLWSHVFVRKLPAGPTRTLAGGDSPAWSPDGKRLAYIGIDSDDGAFSRSVYTVNPDSTGRRRLTRGLDASTPAWSPDGGQIAFATDDDDGLGDVWVMDANGGSQRLLAQGGARPSWSSDGRLIVFTRNDDLIVADVASGDERTLVREGQLVTGRVSGPAWQPFKR